jgi:uncharacterized protein Yka (UPF0111/DUF47 family)
MTEHKRRPDAQREGILSRILPREHDFLGMLTDQAALTLLGLEQFVAWVEAGCGADPEEIRRIEREADHMRYRFEETLLDAFSTPIDRQDLYSLSRQMDYILNFASETAREMYSFGVAPDEAIKKMAHLMYTGTRAVTEGVGVMSSNEVQTREHIREAREAMHGIEDAYIEGMTQLFNHDDSMEAFKRREIYHHLRDGGRALRGTVDVLHRAVVGLS